MTEQKTKIMDMETAYLGTSDRLVSLSDNLPPNRRVCRCCSGVVFTERIPKMQSLPGWQRTATTTTKLAAQR